ncbi:hypothetical protein FRC06_006376, partial [Ceratobasidium sp. 370]
MSKGEKKRKPGEAVKKAKTLTSVAAPLESDSDDEFNLVALSAEAEASYKSKRRGARGRPRASQSHPNGSPTRSSRKEILNTILSDPLPGLL